MHTAAGKSRVAASLLARKKRIESLREIYDSWPDGYLERAMDASILETRGYIFDIWGSTHSAKDSCKGSQQHCQTRPG
jgi:hypothetical protein